MRWDLDQAIRKGDDQLDQSLRAELTEIGTLSFFVAYHDPAGGLPYGFVTRPVVIVEDQILRLIIFALAALVCGLCLVTVDMNWTSALAFYRRQLQAAYLHRAPSDERRSTPHIHALPNTAIGLPYHLMNASVDDRAVGREPPLRTEPFVFSALYCGGPNVGYRPTREYRVYNGGGRTRDIDLADAIAISGAAVNPLRVDNWLVRAVLMVTNFRLHQWLPHPRATYAARPTPINVLRSWPVLPGNARGRKVPALVSVADGGFQDNLGVQALLARRCQTIVAVDAGADPDYLFNDLRRVLSWANLHDIKVSFRKLNQERPFDTGVAPLLPCDRKPKDHPPEADAASDDGLVARLSGSAGRGVRFHERLADQHFVVADLEYPALGKQLPTKAVLIYVKPTMTGDEPVELLTFRKAQPAFPNHPTVEQLFDPATVDAYRRLGEHTGVKVLAEYFDPPPAPPAPAPAAPTVPAELAQLREALAQRLDGLVAGVNGVANYSAAAVTAHTTTTGGLIGEVAGLRLELGQRLHQLIGEVKALAESAPALPNEQQSATLVAEFNKALDTVRADFDGLLNPLRQRIEKMEAGNGQESGNPTPDGLDGLERHVEDLAANGRNLVAAMVCQNQRLNLEADRLRAVVERIDEAIAEVRRRRGPGSQHIEQSLSALRGEMQHVLAGLRQLMDHGAAEAN